MLKEVAIEYRNLLSKTAKDEGASSLADYKKAGGTVHELSKAERTHGPTRSPTWPKQWAAGLDKEGMNGTRHAQALHECHARGQAADRAAVGPAVTDSAPTWNRSPLMSNVGTAPSTEHLGLFDRPGGRHECPGFRLDPVSGASGDQRCHGSKPVRRPIAGVTELIQISIIGIVFLQLADAVRTAANDARRFVPHPAAVLAPAPGEWRWKRCFCLLGAIYMVLGLWGSVPLLLESYERDEFIGNMGVFTAQGLAHQSRHRARVDREPSLSSRASHSLAWAPAPSRRRSRDPSPLTGPAHGGRSLSLPGSRS